jgi:hypothetical protein
MAQKVPKQWKHWCQQAGLTRYGAKGRWRGRYLSSWFYLRGHGRVWRLNDQAQLQCGDAYADFDRWARCRIEQAPRPRSLAEFKATVRELLARARATDAAEMAQDAPK